MALKRAWELVPGDVVLVAESHGYVLPYKGRVVRGNGVYTIAGVVTHVEKVAARGHAPRPSLSAQEACSICGRARYTVRFDESPHTETCCAATVFTLENK